MIAKKEELLQASAQEKLDLYLRATEGGDDKAMFKVMLMRGMMSQQDYDEFSNMTDDDHNEEFDV